MRWIIVVFLAYCIHRAPCHRIIKVLAALVQMVVMVLAGSTGFIAQTLVMRAFLLCMGECAILLISEFHFITPNCDIVAQLHDSLCSRPLEHLIEA